MIKRKIIILIITFLYDCFGLVMKERFHLLSDDFLRLNEKCNRGAV